MKYVDSLVSIKCSNVQRSGFGPDSVSKVKKTCKDNILKNQIEPKINPDFLETMSFPLLDFHLEIYKQNCGGDFNSLHSTGLNLII